MIIDFQIINFTRPEGGDNTVSISPTDNAVKLFMWKSIAPDFVCKSCVIVHKKQGILAVLKGYC